jgi:hypothetical protein
MSVNCSSKYAAAGSNVFFATPIIQQQQYRSAAQQKIFNSAYYPIQTKYDATYVQHTYNGFRYQVYRTFLIKKLRYAPTPDTEVVTKKMLPTKSPGVRRFIYMTRLSG